MKIYIQNVQFSARNEPFFLLQRNGPFLIRDPDLLILFKISCYQNLTKSFKILKN